MQRKHKRSASAPQLNTNNHFIESKKSKLKKQRLNTVDQLLILPAELNSHIFGFFTKPEKAQLRYVSTSWADFIFDEEILKHPNFLKKAKRNPAIARSIITSPKLLKMYTRKFEITKLFCILMKEAENKRLNLSEIKTILNQPPMREAILAKNKHWTIPHLITGIIKTSEEACALVLNDPVLRYKFFSRDHFEFIFNHYKNFIPFLFSVIDSIFDHRNQYTSLDFWDIINLAATNEALAIELLKDPVYAKQIINGKYTKHLFTARPSATKALLSNPIACASIQIKDLIQYAQNINLDDIHPSVRERIVNSDEYLLEHDEETKQALAYSIALQKEQQAELETKELNAKLDAKSSEMQIYYQGLVGKTVITHQVEEYLDEDDLLASENSSEEESEELIDDDSNASETYSDMEFNDDDEAYSDNVLKKPSL